jgi:hypothetical protein
MAVQATRRMVLLLVTALVVVAMMSVAVMAATPAFAQPGGSSNTESCISRVPWSRMMIRGPMPHERRALHVVALNRYAEK